MPGCKYCGAQLPDEGEVDGMCPGCFQHCYYHHARLTVLNQNNLILFLAILPLLVWLVFLVG